jgi:hypothetical protein
MSGLRSLFLSSAAALALAGCNSSSSGGRPPPVDPQVFLAAGTQDLTSALPATPTFDFRLMTQVPGSASALASAIAREAYITPLGGGLRTGVRADLGALNPEIPPGYDEAPAPALRLQPETPLSPGWYELHLGDTSQRARRSPQALTAFSQGGLGLRFRVGSGPVLAAVRFCSQPEASPQVEVIFSEPVRLFPQTRSVSEAVAVSDALGATLACDEPPLPEDGSTDVAPRVRRGEALRSWVLSCAALPSQVSVAVSGAVVNALGQAPQLSAGARSQLGSIDIQALPQDNGCRLLKM